MFRDKIVIVTGGSRGIGFSVAKKFLEQRAVVVLFGSKQETAEDAVSRLKAIDPGYRVSCMWNDVRDYDSVKAAVCKVADEYGRLDILVCSAGITGMGSFYSYTPDYFERVVGVNLFGCFNAAHAAAPIMKAQGGGVMILTSSNTADYGTASGCAYPTSKAAVSAFIRNIGRELAKDNIRVVGVAPSLTDTDMAAGIGPEIKKMVAARNPQGRFATPDEVAEPYLFLASDAASRITGVTLQVSGGGME